MCASCFEGTVRGTVLEPAFTRKTSSSICRFSSPRAKRLLKRADLGSLEEFIQVRSKVAPCPGSRPTTSTKWYNCGIEEFRTCEACYEDDVVGSKFEQRFKPSTTPNAPDVCTFNQPYIKRAFGKASDWAQWRLAVHKRQTAPNCVTAAISPSHMTFYTPSKVIDGFQICESCYLDFFARTRHEAEFRVEDLSHLHVEQKVICSLSLNSLRYLTSTIDAFAEWWNLAKAITLDQSRRFSHSRVRQWYQLAGCNFHLCESCFIGYMGPMEYQAEFEPACVSDDSVECDLCFSSPKQEVYLERLIDSATSAGGFSDFHKTVAIYESIPPFELCPQRKLKADFHGYEYCGIYMCVECHESFARRTFASLNLPAHRAKRIVKNTSGDEYHICELYSPRTRKMWDLVVDGGMKWDDFQSAVWRRRETYFRTVFVIEYLNHYMHNRKHGLEYGRYVVTTQNCGLPEAKPPPRNVADTEDMLRERESGAVKRRRPSWKRMLSQPQVAKKRTTQEYDVQAQITLLESQWEMVE